MSRKQNRQEDRNFDDLARRLHRNVYGGLKGQIRLSILQRDLAPYLQSPLTILDAGGGQGQFSLPLAQAGHTLTLCDISQEMLNLAEQNRQQHSIQNVQLVHSALQDIHQHTETQFDLVLCHAVLEWLAEPHLALEHLLKLLKSNGILSLMFYNTNSIILKNALRTNYQKILDDDYHGYRGSLTPINPLQSEQVLSWCNEAELEILCHSGVRVFYDYRMDPATRDLEREKLLQAELKFSQIEPFRSLGRYIHILARKP
ncbi:tRNA 5-carboxymethoxyuridine methyltransferase [Thalassocella blandensis]|nr:tRNA 5-carboxymethoxyuridine methyltransferase [Thalassocella blandensis]